MKDQSSYSDIWIGSEDLGRDEKFIDQATQEMPDGSVASMLAQGASFATAQTGLRDRTDGQCGRAGDVERHPRNSDPARRCGRYPRHVPEPASATPAERP